MRRNKWIYMLFVFYFILTACSPTQKNSTEEISPDLQEVYMAGGCFWGVEEYFSRIDGVTDVVSGYANGKTETPRYSDVIYADTGHAETVKVVYDANRISLLELVGYYLIAIDPTLDRTVGYDPLIYYRHGIYYVNENEKDIINAMIDLEQKKYDKPIAVEVEPLLHFSIAEDYHQDYLKNFPEGFCHIQLDKAEDSIENHYPEIYKKGQLLSTGLKNINPLDYPKPFKSSIKQSLTDLQYDITQNNQTEPSFDNAYHNLYDEGIFVDIVTGEPLFSSRDKYDSFTGWPSFTKPIHPDVVIENEDKTLSMVQIEIKSRTGQSHLGHIFDDGPWETGGYRYCINSAALRFIPKDDMEEEGYGYLLEIFE